MDGQALGESLDLLPSRHHPSLSFLIISGNQADGTSTYVSQTWTAPGESARCRLAT
ncbi:hypothetical protein COMA2_20434 [Candidatus Nitrospira nitrificans]|uniref:Uncharacterized protein n=1 Tax=Candidatus Nitrospira nitrificans TaxID=1742973 RepID=A0A0S4LFV6_9BACT|nr:hypothetical protein COMA2_20434 [Candidatus Nitrospira nitrificans]